MSAPALTTYTDDLIQAHREAFQALREILSDALLCSRDCPDDPAERARQRTLTQRLSLRLRAAVAVLRVRPDAAAAARRTPDITLNALAAAFSATPPLPAPTSHHPAASLCAAAGAAHRLGHTASLSDLLRAS